MLADAKKRPSIEVRNPNVAGYSHKVDAIKYEAMKKALLKVLPKKPPGLTQTEMRKAVVPHLPEVEFPGGAKADWWSKCVQLDLEAQGVVRREDSKPLRWHRAR
jgi:hypothetical protein